MVTLFPLIYCSLLVLLDSKSQCKCQLFWFLPTEIHSPQSVARTLNRNLSGHTIKPDDRSLTNLNTSVMPVTDGRGFIHARIRIGCSKLKSHLYNNLHAIEEESCQCGHRNEVPFHFFFECPRYIALRNNLFMSVAQHTDCSLKTLLFGDPELNRKQNCDIFDAVQHFITLSKHFDCSPYAVSYCTLPLHLQPPLPTFPGHTASKQSP